MTVSCPCFCYTKTTATMDNQHTIAGLHTAYLSLGTNLGDRQANMRRAVQLLGSQVGRVERLSSVIETEPWGYTSSNMFLNACVCIATPLTPLQLLRATQEVERQLGRTHKSVHGAYHDRPMDIDILLYDDISLDTPELKIPHPLMRERDFVMRPLMEIIG